MRVTQRGERPSLAGEARLPLGVGSQGWRHELEGDVAPEDRVPRAIHLTHASRAREGRDPIRTDLPTDERVVHLRRQEPGGRLQEPFGCRRAVQQRLDFEAQLRVVRTLGVEPRTAVLGVALEGLVIQPRHPTGSLRLLRHCGQFRVHDDQGVGTASRLSTVP